MKAVRIEKLARGIEALAAVRAAEGAFAAGHKFWGNQWSKHAQDAANDPVGEPSGKIRHAVLVIGGKRYKGPSHWQAFGEYSAVNPRSKDNSGGWSNVQHEGFETESGHFLDREQAALYVPSNYSLGDRATSRDLKLGAVDGSLYTQDAVQASTPERGCLMAMVHGALEDELLAWGKANVPDAALDPENGRESETHVTVLYGFNFDFDANRLQVLLAGYGPVKFTLGKVSRFECSDYDVLKVDIDSPELERLHAELVEEFFANKEPSEHSYHLHLTIAYLKKGKLKELDGSDAFAGRKVTAVDLLYSLPERKGRHLVELGWEPKVAATAVRTGTVVNAAQGAFAPGHPFHGNQHVRPEDFGMARMKGSLGRMGYHGSSDPSVRLSAQIHPDAVFITRLDAVEQGKGAGSKAMGRLKDFATKSGRRLELTAGADTPELQGRLNAFYERHGFKKTDDAEHPSYVWHPERHSLAASAPRKSDTVTASEPTERERTLAAHRRIRSEAQAGYQRAVDRAVAVIEAAAVADAKRADGAKRRKKREEELEAVALLLFLAHKEIYMAASHSLAALVAPQSISGPLTAPQPTNAPQGTPSAGQPASGQPVAYPAQPESWRMGGGGPVAAEPEEATDFATSRAPLLLNFPVETADRLDKELAEGRAAGESVEELARRVKRKAAEVEAGSGRVVAETEATATLGMAQLHVLQRAGFATCMWDQLERETKRATHAENVLEGEVPVGHVFSNGQQCPGDSVGGAAENANCCCTLIPGKRKAGTGHLQGSEATVRTGLLVASDLGQVHNPEGHNQFTVGRMNQETGEFHDQTYRIGEWVRVSLNSSTHTHGRIAHISHVNRNVRLKGSQRRHDFGMVYKAPEPPAPEQAKKVSLRSVIDKVNDKNAPPGGWTEEHTVPKDMQAYRPVKGSAAAGSVRTGTVAAVEVSGYMRQDTRTGRLVQVAPHRDSREAARLPVPSMAHMAAPVVTVGIGHAPSLPEKMMVRTVCDYFAADEICGVVRLVEPDALGSFEAGGKTWSKAGEWNNKTKTAVSTPVPDVLAHELGHAEFDFAKDRAVIGIREARDVAMLAHGDKFRVWRDQWADGGLLHPDASIAEPKTADQELYNALLKFRSTIGHDISRLPTDYAKSWAKEPIVDKTEWPVYVADSKGHEQDIATELWTMRSLHEAYAEFSAGRVIDKLVNDGLVNRNEVYKEPFAKMDGKDGRDAFLALKKAIDAAVKAKYNSSCNTAAT